MVYLSGRMNSVVWNSANINFISISPSTSSVVSTLRVRPPATNIFSQTRHDARGAC